MIVDASALLAILFDESDADRFRRAISDEREDLLISPVNFVEAAIREITSHQTRLAREAYKTFGKGKHPAKLNLGDCFAYALAKARGEPLLFKGGDFGQTDIEAAI